MAWYISWNLCMFARACTGPAVRRLMLQAAKTWTENQNNINNTRTWNLNYAYNSLLSAEYVGLHFIKQACLVIPKLCWHSWTLISHPSRLAAFKLARAHWHRTRIQVGVRQLLKTGMRNPDIIRNNSKLENNRYNSEIVIQWNNSSTPYYAAVI